MTSGALLRSLQHISREEGVRSAYREASERQGATVAARVAVAFYAGALWESLLHAAMHSKAVRCTAFATWHKLHHSTAADELCAVHSCYVSTPEFVPASLGGSTLLLPCLFLGPLPTWIRACLAARYATASVADHLGYEVPPAAARLLRGGEKPLPPLPSSSKPRALSVPALCRQVSVAARESARHSLRLSKGGGRAGREEHARLRGTGNIAPASAHVQSNALLSPSHTHPHWEALQYSFVFVVT